MIILVLDLDETLVHTERDPNYKGDFSIDGYNVRKRPYLDELIQYLTDNPYYQVGIWSAGVGSYVRSIVDNIFPNISILKFVMARDYCNEAYKKPLSKVRDLYNTVYDTNLGRSDFLIIDDRRNITDFDELNHIQIKAYRGEADDKELLSLIDFLDANKGLPSECMVVMWG